MELILKISMVCILFILIYVSVNKNAKNKAKIEEHIKNGDIVTGDVNDNHLQPDIRSN